METHARYDQVGNIRYSWDAKGNQSKVFYDDSFCNDNGQRCGGTFTPNSFAFATRAETPAPGTGGYGATAPLATTSVYDFHTGLTYSATDPNGQTTRYEYENQPAQLDRVKAMVRPDGGRTDFNYGDAVGSFYVQTLTDALGRVRKVTTRPDGAALVSGYSGDRVLVKDQAGKERVSRTDALGRLREVWEVTASDPAAVAITAFPGHSEAAYGYQTIYTHDALGNLRQAVQVTQTRTFVYDALSRLTSATNPESGTVSYAYDPNGNLLTKTDARGRLTPHNSSTT